MIFSCGNAKRRRLVRGNATLNGIDYVEVGTGNGPDARRTLLVHLLNPLAGPIPPAGCGTSTVAERYRGSPCTASNRPPTTMC
jgi:hypothetical protein